MSKLNDVAKQITKDSLPDEWKPHLERIHLIIHDILSTSSTGLMLLSGKSEIEYLIVQMQMLLKITQDVNDKMLEMSKAPDWQAVKAEHMAEIDKAIKQIGLDKKLAELAQKTTGNNYMNN